MCTYLAKRGSVYYFRRPIPVSLRDALGGRAEFILSLRTKDRNEAKRLIPLRLIETERLLLAASGEGDSSLKCGGSVRPTASGIPPTFPCYGPRHRATEIPPRHRSASILATGDRERQSTQKSVKMLDTDVIEGWAAERKPVQKGIDTHRAVARWFYERVGKKPVTAITRSDVLAFKAKLIEEGTSAANMRMKLSRLRTLLQWAADNNLAAENVAKGIGIKDAAQAKNRRREFDLDSLRRIFSSPVFISGERPAGGRGEAAYWLPILALYTGARLEELGQLRPCDVMKRSYVDAAGIEQQSWFIYITSDETAGMILKSASSERLVPVHHELKRLGFITLATNALDARQHRLFPALKPNIYGRLTAKWGEWFGSHLRNVCRVSDKRLVFHSFRHTFKHYARHCSIEEGVQRQIMGHSSGDVADRYGSGYSLYQLVIGLQQYAIPGLELVSSQEPFTSS